MTVFAGSALSWVTNSRPRPRFVPVMSQVGILAREEELLIVREVPKEDIYNDYLLSIR